MVKKYFIRVVVVVSIAFVCMASCGVVTTLRAKNTDPTVAVDVPVGLPSDPFMVSISNEFALMAWFAETAYRRELLADNRDSTA